MKAFYPKYLKTDPSIAGLTIKELMIAVVIFNLFILNGVKAVSAIILIIICLIIYKVIKYRVDLNSLILKRYKLEQIDLTRLIKNGSNNE